MQNEQKHHVKKTSAQTSQQEITHSKKKKQELRFIL
jgi:hypothetical protein